MDKTRNKIFVGCLALLLVMVAGYALFSQNLTINGTAKAEGNSSLVVTCQPGLPDNLLEAAKTYLTELKFSYEKENGYYDDSCTVNGNSINYKSSFKYPGARRYFIVKVKNTGSIDMIPNLNTKSNADMEFCLDENHNGEYELDECHSDNFGYVMGGMDILEMYGITQPFAFETKDGNLLSYADIDNMPKEEQSNFVTENGDMVLKPGFSHYYLLPSGLNKKLGDPDSYTIDFSSNPNFMMKFSITEYLEYTQPTTK